MKEFFVALKTFISTIPLELQVVIYTALSTALIKLVGWYFKRRQQKKSLSINFYFEIENHRITDLGYKNGQPTFAIDGFSDVIYKNELSLATKLFDVELIQRLCFYYSKLRLANEYQKKLEEVIIKISNLRTLSAITSSAMVAPVDELEELRKKVESILAVISVCTAPAQKVREDLLSELKKLSDEDPSKSKFIDALPQHKEWWEKIQTEAEKKQNKTEPKLKDR